MLEALPAGPPASPNCAATIAALRQRGAAHFDPVRFRFIEGLAGRLPGQREAVRDLLEARLAKTLNEYRARFEAAQAATRETVSRTTEQFPEASDVLRCCGESGDFAGLRRCVTALQSGGEDAPLADLLRHIAHHGVAEGSAAAGGGHASSRAAPGGAPPAGSAGELKALRYFRNTWSKLSVEQQLTQALAQGPENAGPLNSHRLVLQSMQRLRELSPDYLNRLMSYVDALLWLDLANGGPAIKKNLASAESDKKRKTARPKSPPRAALANKN